LTSAASPCSALALTVTIGRPAASDAAGAAVTTTALPSMAATSPLPASRRSSTCRGDSRPEMAGAVLPATSAGGAISSSRAWRARSLSACASGCAAMSIGTGAAAWACAAVPAKASAMDKASGAAWKRGRDMRAISGKGK
jgi:hypothetical protein